MRQTAAESAESVAAAAALSEAELDAACPWHVKGGRGHLCLDCFDRLMAAIPDELARYRALRDAAATDTTGETERGHSMATPTADTNMETPGAGGVDGAGSTRGGKAGKRHDNETTAGETVDVAGLVRAEIQQERDRRISALRQEQQRQDDERGAWFARFRAEMERIFPPAWRAALALTYRAVDASDAHDGPLAWLHIGETTWRAHPWHEGIALRRGDGRHADLDAIVVGFTVDAAGAVPADVRTAIIQQIAGCEIRREEQIADEQERARAGERRRAEHEARRAAIRTEHEACLAEIEAARVAERATAWQWPDGVVLTLYRWEWQKARDEDGGPVMGWGWATEATLQDIAGTGRTVDARWEAMGSIHLRAMRALGERTINLSYHTHLPASYTRRFASVAELPHELTSARQVTVEGIAEQFSDELGERVYVRRAGAHLTLTVNDDALEWVRAAVEAARLEQQPEGVPF